MHKIMIFLIINYWNAICSASIFIMLTVGKPDLVKLFSFLAIWEWCGFLKRLLYGVLYLPASMSYSSEGQCRFFTGSWYSYVLEKRLEYLFTCGNGFREIWGRLAGLVIVARKLLWVWTLPISILLKPLLRILNPSGKFIATLLATIRKLG